MCRTNSPIVPKTNIEKIRPNYILAPCVLLLFCALIARVFYLCTVDYKVGEETISAFIKSRNTEEDTILPKRGSILDANNNVLAEDVASYSVIAYLDEKRSENSKIPLHVVDPDATAEKLAPYINMKPEDLKLLLKKVMQLIMLQMMLFLMFLVKVLKLK